MKASHWGWLLGAALFVTQARAGQEVGDYRGLPADLAAAATAYDLAQYKADRAELERLLADDYILGGSSGKPQSKQEFIADQVAPGSKTTSMVLDITVRQVWPNGAVLGGTADAKGLDRGKPYALRIRFADVWAKRDGRWQVIYTAANKIP